MPKGKANTKDCTGYTYSLLPRVIEYNSAGREINRYTTDQQHLPAPNGGYYFFGTGLLVQNTDKKHFLVAQPKAQPESLSLEDNAE